MEVKKIRDLTLVKLDNEKSMVIACDSCGGIGQKEGDVFQLSPFYVGQFTARVAMLEVLASGAEIVTITNAVCNEMLPTGEEIIRGIGEALREAQIDDIVLTGSTEENFKTTATGLGITVIGIAQNKSLRIKNIRGEALLVCLGLPKVGGEIKLPFDSEILNYDVIKALLKLEEVYEIVPVGSKGIKYEANLLADTNGRKLSLNKALKLDVDKSGGPATCAIVAIREDSINILTELGLPVNIIGYIK